MQVRESIILAAREGGNKRKRFTLAVVLVLGFLGFGILGFAIVKYDPQSRTLAQWLQTPNINTSTIQEISHSSGDRKLLQLPPVNVTLGADLNRQLHLVLICEVAGDLNPERIETRFPQFTHEILRLLERKTAEDMRSSADKQQLLDDIKNRLNALLGAPMVQRVYYDKFLHN